MPWYLVFFGYTKFYSVTAMLTELGLQKFDSLIDKCRNDFQRQICGCDNSIVQYLVYLHLMWLIYVMWLYCCILSVSFCLFTVLLLCFFYCSMGPVPEIKIDWLIDWLIDYHIFLVESYVRDVDNKIVLVVFRSKIVILNPYFFHLCCLYFDDAYSNR